MLQESAGLKGRCARVVVGGGRKAAYDAFCQLLSESAKGDSVWLLVDAEDAVVASSRWEHVRTRVGDGWKCPPGATENHLHLMNQVMETWLLADPAALKEVFKARFAPAAIPAWPDLEAVPKLTIYDALKKATGAGTNAYDKGQHSFKVLALVDATKLAQACAAAAALFTSLKK